MVGANFYAFCNYDYFVYPSFVEAKMNWSEANEDCDAKGGKLVEINSEEENTALVEEIKRREYEKMNFWIGLTDRKSERDWVLESSGLTPAYTNWGDTEPNNWDGEDIPDNCH